MSSISSFFESLSLKLVSTPLKILNIFWTSRCCGSFEFSSISDISTKCFRNLIISPRIPGSGSWISWNNFRYPSIYPNNCWFSELSDKILIILTIIVLVSWLLTRSNKLTIFLRIPELFWKSALYLGLLTTFSAVTKIEFKNEDSSCWTPCSPSSPLSSAALNSVSLLLFYNFLNNLHEFLEVLENMLKILRGHSSEF